MAIAEPGDREELQRLRAVHKTLTARSGVGTSGLCCSSRRNTSLSLAGSRHAEFPARPLFVHLPWPDPGTLPCESGDVSGGHSPSPLGMGIFSGLCGNVISSSTSHCRFKGYAPMGADGWDCSLLYAVCQTLALFFSCTATVNGAAGHNRGEVGETPPLARTRGRTVGCIFHLIDPVVCFLRVFRPNIGEGPNVESQAIWLLTRQSRLGFYTRC